MNNLQKIYEDAYNAEWAKRAGTSGIRVVDSSGKVYEQEGNFFLCGFNWIKYSGTDRKLTKEMATQGLETRKAYGGGMHIRINEIGMRGNGDYQIQTVAYSAVAAYLNDQGHSVELDSRLD